MNTTDKTTRNNASSDPDMDPLLVMTELLLTSPVDVIAARLEILLRLANHLNDNVLAATRVTMENLFLLSFASPRTIYLPGQFVTPWASFRVLADFILSNDVRRVVGVGSGSAWGEALLRLALIEHHATIKEKEKRDVPELVVTDKKPLRSFVTRMTAAEAASQRRDGDLLLMFRPDPSSTMTRDALANDDGLPCWNFVVICTGMDTGDHDLNEDARHFLLQNEKWRTAHSPLPAYDPMRDGQGIVDSQIHFFRANRATHASS